MKSGFTLIEILAVLGIISILSLVALGSFGVRGGSSIMVSGNNIAGLANLARNTAISKGTLVRLCVLNKLQSNGAPSSDDYTAFSIWSYNRDSATSNDTPWIQETKWQRLLTGVVADNYNVNGSSEPNGYSTKVSDHLPLQNNVLDPAYPPSLTVASFKGSINGTAIDETDCAFIEFDGTGGMSDPTVGVIGFRLVEGHYNNGQLVYTHPVPGNPALPNNYAFVAVNGLTGRVDLVRK